MGEVKIAVGDQVRVHLHPAGPWKSFSEGVVRRVDVTTEAGRFFVLEVRNEVLLDQLHRIRPDFHDYVQYDGQKDFPRRIEVLNPAEQDMETEIASAPLPAIAPVDSVQELGEPPLVELEVHSEPEVEPTSEAEAEHEPTQGDAESQPVREQGGLLSALFGRRR